MHDLASRYTNDLECVDNAAISYDMNRADTDRLEYPKGGYPTGGVGNAHIESDTRQAGYPMGGIPAGRGLSKVPGDLCELIPRIRRA